MRLFMPVRLDICKRYLKTEMRKSVDLTGYLASGVNRIFHFIRFPWMFDGNLIDKEVQFAANSQQMKNSRAK